MASLKFGRTCQLVVQSAIGVPVFITPPFTIEFDITRKTLASANVAQFRIYNLGLQVRNALRFNISNFGTYRQCVFLFGYGLQPYVAFQGNITQAWSFREGSNFITQIECYDGGFAISNGLVGGANGQLPPGLPTDKAILKLMTTGLPNVRPGAVGNFPQVSTTAQSYNGNTTKLLSDLAPNKFFIDNEKAYALNDNEVVADPPIVVTAASGLLGTPMLESTIVHFDMLMEPRLTLGSPVILQSFTEAAYNGQYRVQGLKHRGVISDAVCGSAITTLECNALNNLTTPVLVPRIS